LTGGLFTGLERATAARFSFLLSMPAIAASGLLEVFEVARSQSLNWTAVGVATLVAAISGYLSIEFLLRYLQRHTAYLFVGYRLIVGLIIIGLLMAGTISPG
jgi:undecaprenyl-diphosphatase